MKSNLLNADSALLLIIDIQEKLINVQDNKEKIIKNSVSLVEAAKIFNIPIKRPANKGKGFGRKGWAGFRMS